MLAQVHFDIIIIQNVETKHNTSKGKDVNR